MGLFGGSSDEDETEEVDPPEATSAEDGADPETPDPSDEVEGQQATAETQDVAASDAEGTGADEEAPSDDDLDVEEALKELSARMAMLSSNLEGVQESRGELEDKLGSVEERMSRLGSLAEAVSSEYNPFISENAPDEPSWTPELEVAEDRAQNPPSDPSSGEDEAHDTIDPDEIEALNAAEASRDEPPVGPNGEGTAPDEGAPAEAPGADAGSPEPEAAMPRTDPDRLEPAQAEPIEDVDPQPAPETAADDLLGASMPRHADDGLEENLLMLEWVGMMLDRVGRAGLMDLLDYYQNLGWLDKHTKDTATRVAIGVEAPDRAGDGHWRGDVELHRKSLVAIQRLQGNEVPAARIDELQLDLRRLFEG